MDADSLQTCEEVCLLWRRYIRREKIWKKVREKEPTTISSISNSPRRLISQFPLSSFFPKVVQRNAMSSPALVRQNGWSQHLPALGGKQPEDLKIYRDVSIDTAASLVCDFPSPTSKKTRVANVFNVFPNPSGMSYP